MPPRNEQSPYLGVRFSVTASGKKFFDFRLPQPRTVFQGSSYVTVQEGDSLHLIAHRFYGRQQWWWLLLDYNEIVDPTQPLVVGTEILVPPLPAARAKILGGV